MSIFRKTLKPFVTRQLQTRQTLLHQGSDGGQRTQNVQKYTSSKRAWSKMVSFVNYEDKSRGYSGDALARKYVLQAGTLISDPNDSTGLSLRYGINNANGAYGSNLGSYKKGEKAFGTRPLGIRPMPGIIDVTVVNKTAFGSLRQATIKYKAWDKTQLEDLEILFMRTGFPVLLEWGWSMYMDTSKPGDTSNDLPNNGTINTSESDLNELANRNIKSFTEPTIDPFDSNKTQYDIYDDIKRLQHQFSGNYDGMLGFVQNFTWELAPDGGFDCTTVLISIGDTLASLKMNRPSSLRTEKKAEEGFKSEFTRLMDDIIFKPQDELISSLGVSKNLKNSPLLDFNVTQLGSFTRENKSAANNSVTGPPTYIQMSFFVALLNEKFNLFDEKGSRFINIEIPIEDNKNKGNGLCLASEDSVSIDPNVCLIKNKKAEFITGLRGVGYDIGSILNKPELIKLDFLTSGEKPGRNLGIIGNIYLSVQFLKDEYERQGSASDVNMYDLLHEILKRVSYALGSINDFDLFVMDNKVVIMDKNYVEKGADANSKSKFKLNLFGNNSIVRNNYKVFSKIFQSQATEVAVAAGSQNRQNLGGINTATQLALTKGLSNRLYTTLNIESNKENKQDNSFQILKERQDLARSVLDIQTYLKQFLIDKIFPTEAYSRTAVNTLLNSIHLNLNTDTLYRSVIPISLEVTLDGISGIDQGEIFVIEPGVLPKEYERKDLGFIVTHEQQNIANDWTTTLQTKVVLLHTEDPKEYIELSNIKQNLLLLGAGLVNDDFLKSQYNIQYYRKLLVFIKMYYEGYFNLDLDLTHPIRSSVVQTLITFKYKSIILKGNRDEVLSKYLVNGTSYDIKASDVLSSMDDNTEVVSHLSKYKSYNLLEQEYHLGYFKNKYDYRLVSEEQKKGNQIVTLSSITPQVNYEFVDNIENGYIPLLKPFENNSAKEEIKALLKEFIIGTTNWAHLPKELQKDLEDKMKLINTSLLDNKSGEITVTPLEAESKGGSVTYTKLDTNANLTISYEKSNQLFSQTNAGANFGVIN